MLEEAGISNGTHVILYDDQGGRMATRLWYVLNAFGHDRVSVVNGGWPRWLAEDRPTATRSPAPPAGRFTPRENPSMTCPTPQLLAQRPNVVLLDTRSEAEFTGQQVSPGATKAGRIPTSVHVDWRENVSGEHQTFRPAGELRALYEAQGVTPDKEIVPY
jgi:thiosulfate/3-mercaptopyruvate sulfurtransferase